MTGRTIQDIQGQDTVTWLGAAGSHSRQDETNPELILAASVISDQKYLQIRRSGDECSSLQLAERTFHETGKLNALHTLEKALHSLTTAYGVVKSFYFF